MPISEKLQEKNAEIEKILDNWGLRPVGISHGKREEKRRDIERWLRRFSPSEFDDALLILKKIQYHDDLIVDVYIEGLSKELKLIFEDNFLGVRFFPLGKSPASSGGNFLYSYRKELGLSEDNFPYTSFKETDLSDVTALVFFDDIIGSGNQALTFAEKNLHDITIKKYYIAFLAFEKGYNNVKKSKYFDNVIVHEILSDEFKAFSPNSQVFPDKDTRERIKKLCMKYGEKLYSHPLGYDNSQALIVFPHNTPNNTLPIIWASDKNEKKPGIIWYPVWERKKIKRKIKDNNLPKIWNVPNDRNPTVERILDPLNKIEKIGIEFGKPLLTIEEYMKMPDIKPLLKYEKFIGRYKELNVIRKFVEAEEKIIVIIGDGGVGKTRLIIEFAKQMKEESDWNIYFVNPELNIDRLPEKEKILLILDESTRYRDRDKLIMSVLSHISEDVRLLLIDRPIFKSSIENFLVAKNISYKFAEIGKGNIVGFLKEQCNWIDENVAKKIDEECRNSFDFAIVYAEYYNEKRIIEDIEKILSWKMAKYIKDIKDRSGLDVADIKSTIQLISLITPVTWEDIEYINKSPIINNECFENVLRLVSENESNILIFSYGENKYEIKPDILADHLRLELIENKNFVRILRNLIPYMPYRISYNIAILKKLEYLFSWDEIPGNDSNRLINFLMQNYCIDWVKNAEIKKSDDDKKITGYVGKNSFSLRLNDKRNEVSLDINDSGEKSEFIAKIINGKLKIYKLDDKILEILDQILNELTNMKDYNLEYFETLVLIGKTTESGILYPGKYWDTICQLVKNYQEENSNFDKEMRNRFAYFWARSISRYGNIGQIFKMKFCLNEIKKLREEYQHDDELRKYLIAEEAFTKFKTKIKKISSRQKLVFDSIMEKIEKRRLFSWDEIPGNDSVKLINFLKQNYDIDWVKNATIKKIDNGKTIKVYVNKNCISLSLDNEKTKVKLRIDDGRTDEFIAKTKNGKLNISQKDLKYPIIKPHIYDNEMLQNNDSLLKLLITNIGGVEAKDVNIELHSEIDKKLSKKATPSDYPQLKEIKPSRGGHGKEITFTLRPTTVGKVSLIILSSYKSIDGKNFQNKEEIYVIIHPEDFKNSNI